MPPATIHPMTSADWECVRDIYPEGIATGNSTFEQTAPEWERWERARGRGVGRELLTQLVHESEAAGIWTLQAGIFPENLASIQLHTAAGFRVIGKRERIGCMHERWRDAVLMERRSAIVGR